MAEEIRIPRGDSRVLQFAALDAATGDYMTDLTDYKILFSTETLIKTSDSNPSEVLASTDGDGNPVILVYLTVTDTNPTATSLIHYDVKIYKEAAPTIMITGSSGDLIFTNE